MSTRSANCLAVFGDSSSLPKTRKVAEVSPASASFIESTPPRLLPSKNQACTTRLRDQFLPRQGENVALHINKRLPAVHDPRASFEQRVLHGTNEVDLEFER